IEFQVIDTRGKLWKFKLSFRSGSGAYRKPVITGEWLSFVKDKGVQVGDTVTIFKQNNGTAFLHIFYIISQCLKVQI
ncbi:B3 domain-containing protein, partial [Nocardia farcinica]|nr:B3 domain-containing protein [Nocardia farcinica]